MKKLIFFSTVMCFWDTIFSMENKIPRLEELSARVVAKNWKNYDFGQDSEKYIPSIVQEMIVNPYRALYGPIRTDNVWEKLWESNAYNEKECAAECRKFIIQDYFGPKKLLFFFHPSNFFGKLSEKYSKKFLEQDLKKISP